MVMVFWLEETCLWRLVLVARYGVSGGAWCTGRVRGTHGCDLWKGILVSWDTFLNMWGTGWGLAIESSCGMTGGVVMSP